MVIHLSVPTPFGNGGKPLVMMGKCPEIIGMKGKLEFREPLPVIAYTGDPWKPTMYIFESEQVPTNVPAPPEAAMLAKLFNMSMATGQAFRVKLDLPKTSFDLEEVDKCLAVVYRSGKETGDTRQPYIHKHSAPLPTLFKCKTAYIIAGGKFNVRDWIYE